MSTSDFTSSHRSLHGATHDRQSRPDEGWRSPSAIVRTSFKPLLIMAIGACVLLAAGGCSTRNHDADGTPKAQNYPVDGYMGLTSVSPNDPLNPTYHHYRDDLRLMRSAIAQIPGIQDSAINLNGPVASVKVKLANGTSEEEGTRIREQVYQALSQNMPRYVVKVSTTR